ncbi:hypothetical protein ACGFNV_45805 [Streptomyces sp. NPDC048751]|uniref:hypothetical protein n=1 Tax=Streptomyces sp. NPDC048751 TaxID=3365591 RepID=UPI00371B9484
MDTSRDAQVVKSPLAVRGSRANSWKEATRPASRASNVSVKVIPRRWLNAIAAENSRTQAPVDPTERVADLTPLCVPGPKTPLATSSVIPISYCTAYISARCTSRE